MKFKITSLLVFVVLSVSGCDNGFRTMGSSEYAVVFSALPRFLGGGIRERTLEPGEMEFILPWQSVYVFDTSVQAISWGGVGSGDRPTSDDYVETRAKDGNEVGLAMTVQYHIDPRAVRYVVQKVGSSNERIRQLVSAVARADIRTHMNILYTRDFFSPIKRQAAVDEVKEAINARLQPQGIIIDAVIYNDHRFERRMPDDTFDRSYQEQIDKTQATNQQTEREKKKIAAVIEEKKRQFNDAKAEVNRTVEAAEGYKRQAQLRGDAYLTAKQNEAKQITTTGMSEVEGLKKQVAAFSGPGGEALVRLSLVRALVDSNPSFILMSSEDGQGGNSIGVRKTDTNELLHQFGLATAASEAMTTKAAAPTTTPQPSK